MSAEKREKTIFWAIIVSELSHVFCCVLPTLFSVVSLLTGFGIVATMPGWLEGLHDTMHGWELTMIGVSAGVIVLGWALHFYNEKHKCCHSTGCEHPPCGPRKKTASKILIAATILLAFNLTIYFGIHRPHDQVAHHHEETHAHHGHDHHE